VKSFAYSAFLVLWWAFACAGLTQEKPPAQESKQQATPAQKPPVKEAPAEEKIPPAGPNAMFPSVVARVNGKPLLGRDLEQRIREELLGIGSPSWQNLRDDYRKELVNRHLTSLVGTELLYQNATAMGVQATDAEVQAEFDKVAKSSGSDAAFNTELASRGMERADLRKEIEKTLVVNKFIQENIDKKIVVAPAEVSDYYAKHPDEFKHGDIIRTSHILIAVPQNATAEQETAARQRAEALLLRVRKGEDFAKLARESSMDDSASLGGDIGYTEKGQLDPAYENAAWSLAVGQASGLIRTSFGYHIIKVTDKKKAGQATLEEVRTQLTNFLKDQKRASELDNLVKDLRQKAKITFSIPAASNPGI
jgi:peptidyl-prolyl cis-trans isomerase C